MCVRPILEHGDAELGVLDPDEQLGGGQVMHTAADPDKLVPHAGPLVLGLARGVNIDRGVRVIAERAVHGPLLERVRAGDLNLGVLRDEVLHHLRDGLAVRPCPRVVLCFVV